MIVERIPKFLSSPHDYSDTFFFDNNGRFIFVKRIKDTEFNPIFIIYDVMFNNYVELTAKSTPKLMTQYEYDSIWQHILYFLPINIEEVLCVIQSGEATTLLLLVHFDLQQKTYEMLDYVPIFNCEHPEFVHEGDVFGLFFKSPINGHSVSLVDNETSHFTFLNFTVEASRLKLGKAKKLDYKPYNMFCYPLDVYLRNNKLWYIRTKDHDVPPAPPPSLRGRPRSPEDPSRHNLLVCYFDLNENYPPEIIVDEIEFESPKPNLTMLWYQDLLVLLRNQIKFDTLDLLSCEWSSEAFDCGQNFNNLDTHGEWETSETWIEFQHSKSEDAYWAKYATVHIDEQSVLTAVNRRSAVLHLIPIRKPMKLLKIAWLFALNSGLINEKTSLPPNLPYSRLF